MMLGACDALQRLRLLRSLLLQRAGSEIPHDQGKVLGASIVTARLLPVLLLLCSPLTAVAGKDRITALDRTNGVNYKDMALASCIAEAYKGSPAGKDATDTAATYLEWTYYDLDKGNAAVDKLVEKYLHRDYSTPIEGYADAKFDLLKCFDMYHSRELDEQVRKYVPHPDWVGDRPPKRKN